MPAAAGPWPVNGHAEQHSSNIQQLVSLTWRLLIQIHVCCIYVHVSHTGYVCMRAKLEDSLRLTRSDNTRVCPTDGAKTLQKKFHINR